MTDESRIGNPIGEKSGTEEGTRRIVWPEFVTPPINLTVLQPALEFYSDESDNWEDDDAL